MKKQKAILYARTGRTACGDPLFSIQYQLDDLHSYCEEHNIEIVMEQADMTSGISFDRPGFNKLLKYADNNQGAIDLLLVRDWDRFSRNPTDAIDMESKLLEMGIKTVAINQSGSLATYLMMSDTAADISKRKTNR